MKTCRLLGVFILCALCFSMGYAQNIDIKPYRQGDWAAVLQSADGKPMAVHIWGVTCAPCMKEMPQWGKFLEKNKKDRAIFLQVDDVSLGMMSKMLMKAHLDHADNYYLVGSFDERLRYEIDPKWHGETPITILIDADGKKSIETGPINFIELARWFSEGS